MPVVRYADLMKDRPNPPAEAGGYFLKPATRARFSRRRRRQEIDPGFSRGWHVPLERARVAGDRYGSFLDAGRMTACTRIIAAKDLGGGGSAPRITRPPGPSPQWF